jgi:hypothetical protein
MKYGKYFKKVGKKFDYKIFVIALVFSLAVVGVAMNVGEFQSEFVVGEDVASFKIAGISYEGNRYLSESDFKSDYPTAQVFSWKSDKKSFDVDGPITYTDLNMLDGSLYMNEFGGMMPDITFEITKTPFLVDLDGNEKSGGYTDLIVRSDGANQYMYHYKTQLKIRVDMGVLDLAGMREIGAANSQYAKLFYDGANREIAGIGEYGIMRNINALLSVDLPEVEGYTCGWEMHIDATHADMIFSHDGTVYTESNYLPVFNEWPEGLFDIIAGNGQFHVNMNDNVQRTNSVGEKLVPVDIGGTEVVTVGLTQALVPAISRTLANFFITFQLDSTTEIMKFTPVVYYDLLLKVAMVDEVIPEGNTTTTTTNTNTWKPFTWEPISFDFDTTQLLLIGGGIFSATLIIGFMFKRKQESYGY